MRRSAPSFDTGETIADLREKLGREPSQAEVDAAREY
jgi:hypothetical protein